MSNCGFHALRTPAAWALYWVGAGVAKVINWIPDSWPDWPGHIAYQFYNRAMLWSCDIQSEHSGPWYPPEEWPDELDT